MINEVKTKEKIKEIVKVLPKLNCGRCGFDNCAKFARAVVEGRVSPFGCRENPLLGHKINEIMGTKIPQEANLLSASQSPGFYQPMIGRDVSMLAYRGRGGVPGRKGPRGHGFGRGRRGKLR